MCVRCVCSSVYKLYLLVCRNQHLITIPCVTECLHYSWARTLTDLPTLFGTVGSLHVWYLVYAGLRPGDGATILPLYYIPCEVDLLWGRRMKLLVCGAPVWVKCMDMLPCDGVPSLPLIIQSDCHTNESLALLSVYMVYTLQTLVGDLAWCERSPFTTPSLQPNLSWLHWIPSGVQYIIPLPSSGKFTLD